MAAIILASAGWPSHLGSAPAEISLGVEGVDHVDDGRVGRRTMRRNVMQTNQPATKSQRAWLVALKVIIHRRRRVVTAINPTKRPGEAGQVMKNG
jgi:hypothetical protein